MTPQLEAAIAAIQPLSSTERIQVLNLLLEPTSLTQQSTEFWSGQTIAQLKATQKTSPTTDLKHLTADFWPEEDSIETFLTFLQTQRQETL
jgi:hypothetical protein